MKVKMEAGRAILTREFVEDADGEILRDILIQHMDVDFHEVLVANPTHLARVGAITLTKPKEEN